jgi:HSP20 family protein
MSYLTHTFNRFPSYLASFDDILGDLSRFRDISQLHTTDNGYALELALPGFKREDVSLEVDSQGVLSIKANNTRGARKLERTYQLADTIDVDRVEATLEDGLLKVTLPQKATAKPRQIKVA